MTRLQRALVALVAVALLGACTDDDPEPKVEDPTPSVSSEPTESVTSPTVAPALGPEDTVRAWVEARNAALKSGDTTALRQLNAPQCHTCEEHIRPIEDVFAAGGSFDTEGWTIDGLELSKSSPQKIQVDVGMTMAAGETVQQAGATPVTYPEDHRLMFFRLTSSDSSAWVVNFIGYYS